ncbi:hypothetical protein VP01_16g2 [Puccinia sorghi]|uniref:Uncharacterized protein n=1 Tax=Puccinia sorghi TaxID=27349 RepID=A0A0L6VFL0_9BASI|nr:hypothetical protein VP01_16g2 [Puccinia sorghi]
MRVHSIEFYTWLFLAVQRRQQLIIAQQQSQGSFMGKKRMLFQSVYKKSEHYQLKKKKKVMRFFHERETGHAVPQNIPCIAFDCLNTLAQLHIFLQIQKHWPDDGSLKDRVCFQTCSALLNGLGVIQFRMLSSHPWISFQLCTQRGEGTNIPSRICASNFLIKPYIYIMAFLMVPKWELWTYWFTLDGKNTHEGPWVTMLSLVWQNFSHHLTEMWKARSVEEDFLTSIDSRQAVHPLDLKPISIVKSQFFCCCWVMMSLLFEFLDLHCLSVSLVISHCSTRIVQLALCIDNQLKAAKFVWTTLFMIDGQPVWALNRCQARASPFIEIGLFLLSWVSQTDDSSLEETDKIQATGDTHTLWFRPGQSGRRFHPLMGNNLSLLEQPMWMLLAEQVEPREMIEKSIVEEKKQLLNQLVNQWHYTDYYPLYILHW